MSTAQEVEQQAVEALAYRHEACAKALSGNLLRTEEAVFSDVMSENPWDNGVVLLQHPTFDSLTEIVEQAGEFFDPSVGWTIWSAWTVGDFEHQLLSFTHQHPFMVAVNRIPPKPVPDLTVREARTPGELAVFDSVSIHGWNSEFHNKLADPRVVEKPYRFYVGFDGDTPSCAAMSFVHSGVCWLENVSTIPEKRGKGFGAAISWEAIQLDADVPAVLTASKLGQPVYASLGFTPVSMWTAWQGGAVQS